MQIIKIVENEPRISHKVIAKNTKVQEKNVVELMDKYMTQLKKFGLIPFETEKVANMGRPKREYYLNEQQSTLLITFMRNNEIVINFKVKLVSEFFKMREMLNNQTNIKKTFVNLSDTKVREAFFIAFDGKCYYSKEKLSKTNFHIDHI